MKRGDVFTVVLPGDYGKPRPAVVVQNDALAGFDSIILCPLSSADTRPEQVRLVVEPEPQTGLDHRSEVMTEKITSVSRRRLGEHIGRLAPEVMEELDRRLAFVVGLGG